MFNLHKKNIVKSIKSLWNKVSDFIRYRVEVYGTKNYSFSLFIMLNYFVPVLLVNISGNFLYDSVIYLRVFAIVICLGLLFLEYWPMEWRMKYYPIYWYFCLLFCIPFVASYTIFVTYMSEFWVLNATLSVILLFIITDWLSFAVLMFIGCVLGYVLYTMISYNDNIYYSQSWDVLLLIYIYGFLLTIMFLFIRDKEKIHEKRLQHMELFGGAIAHEVNTPIAIIQMISMTLSDLTKSIATQAQRIEDEDGRINYQFTLPETEYDMVFNRLPNDLWQTSKEAKKVIDVLLMLLKHRGAEYNAVHSMSEIVKEVLPEYFMNAANYKKIKFKQSRDFKFFGTKQYMKQVLKNLLNNALKYAGDDALITIWIDGNSLYVRDNGVGIEQEYIKNLFKPFHEKGTKSTGIGLAFCGILIHNMGGTIECFSEKHHYTEFTITLPAVR